MRFNINKIILWLKNGKIREIEFEPNKINLITGGSHTGKSAILEIFDYCFFASTSRISESMINEHVLWYGINISINDKVYTLARQSLVEGKVSDNYYFSSIGEIPNIIIPNNSEKALKSIFESEFGIDSNAKFPIGYGSNFLKAGSKISLRYFLMFNTISGNIIENDLGVFFDKQNESRYKEALPRIFDLALGIETVKNILTKERKVELENQLVKLLKKNEIVLSKKSDFNNEQIEILKKAKEYSLVSEDATTENFIFEIEKTINGFEMEFVNNSEQESLESSYYSIQRKILNLKKFKTEYQEYKKTRLNLEDSLKPIDFLSKNDSEIIKTSIYSELFDSYTNDLISIKKANGNNTPVDKQVNDTISELENQLEGVRSKLSTYPEIKKNFKNDREKYFFLGQLKSKIEIFSINALPVSTSFEQQIEDLQNEIDLIKVYDTLEKRELSIKLIEEVINEYMLNSKDALSNYSKYKPVFDYKNKALLLRKPKTSSIEHVGSSSNHMFLHLFFTLAMHEVIFQNKSSFVPTFLIIDQPSRPYYGTNGERVSDDPGSDDYKIKKAFELLDTFIETRIKNKGTFQMIVLEHIPVETVSYLKNIHIVEEFHHGNALIPSEYLDMND